MIGITMIGTNLVDPTPGNRGKAASLSLLVLLAVLLSFFRSSAASAQSATVRVDTSTLNGLGTFYAYFQLVDGSITGNGNSQARINNLNLTGGSLAVAPLGSIGAVTGSLPGSLTLSDSDIATGGFADYAHAFTISGASSLLQFDLSLTATSPDFPVRDGFAFMILDANFEPFPTDAIGGVELVRAEFNAAAPVPTGHSTIGAGVPRLTAMVTPQQEDNGIAPEPSAVMLMAPGLVILALVRRRTRAAKKA